MVSDARSTMHAGEETCSSIVRTLERGETRLRAGSRALRMVVCTAAVALVTGIVVLAQDPATPSQAAPPNVGLSDLAAMTFSCPQAALNSAAREAAAVPSEGTYQFSYFRIVNDAHHATFEVHFKSNYVGEPELRYCVALYCQQGWDPKTAKTTATLMVDQHDRKGRITRAAECGMPMQMKGQKRR